MRLCKSSHADMKGLTYRAASRSRRLWRSCASVWDHVQTAHNPIATEMSHCMADSSTPVQVVRHWYSRAVHKRRHLCAWWLSALFFGAWPSTVAAAQAPAEQASVLILLPGQPGLPAASAIASGIRAVLLTEFSFRVSIEME